MSSAADNSVRPTSGTGEISGLIGVSHHNGNQRKRADRKKKRRRKANAQAQAKQADADLAGQTSADETADDGTTVDYFAS